MNFNKNDLIDAVNMRFFETFSHTLDTVDFVPQRYLDKIYAYIFKNMRRAFRRINKEDRKFQRALKHNRAEASE